LHWFEPSRLDDLLDGVIHARVVIVRFLISIKKAGDQQAARWLDSPLLATKLETPIASSSSSAGSIGSSTSASAIIDSTSTTISNLLAELTVYDTIKDSNSNAAKLIALARTVVMTEKGTDVCLAKYSTIAALLWHHDLGSETYELVSSMVPLKPSKEWVQAWSSGVKEVQKHRSSLISSDWSSVTDRIVARARLLLTFVPVNATSKRSGPFKSLSLSLGSSVLDFLFSGPEYEKLEQEISLHQQAASNRVHALRVALDIIENHGHALDTVVFGVRRALETLAPSVVHYMKNISGLGTETKQVLYESVLNLIKIGFSRAEAAMASSSSEVAAMSEVVPVLSALSLVAQDFSAADSSLVVELELTDFLTLCADVKCNHVRAAAMKLLELVTLRCCVTQKLQQRVESEDSAPPAPLQLVRMPSLTNKTKDALEELLPRVTNCISSVLQQSVAKLHSTLAPSKESGVSSPYFIDGVYTCDPVDPGLIVASNHLPVAHSFATWICRVDATKGGAFIVKGSADLLPEADKIKAWSSIVVEINGSGHVALKVSNGVKAHGFQVVSKQPLVVGEWTHFAYAVDPTKNKVVFYINGVEDTSSEMSTMLKNPHAPIVIRKKVIETEHEYANDLRLYWHVQEPEAVKYVVTFDPQTKTEANCDYVRFYSGTSRSRIIGADKYSGGRGSSAANFPGLNGMEPLEIKEPDFEIYFYSDSSNTAWGFKADIACHVPDPSAGPQDFGTNSDAIFVGKPPLYAFKGSVARCLLGNPLFAPTCYSAADVVALSNPDTRTFFSTSAIPYTQVLYTLLLTVEPTGDSGDLATDPFACCFFFE
jgi:Concanavalin A-like lectin/glucanases superfamily